MGARFSLRWITIGGSAVDGTPTRELFGSVSPTRELRWHPRLVFRGAVDGVDDDDLDGAFGGDELDAERFFEGGGEGWQIGGGVGRSGGVERGPFHLVDVEEAGEAGLVDDGPVAGFAELGAEEAHESGHGGAAGT